jgi:hypothetical protein
MGTRRNVAGQILRSLWAENCSGPTMAEKPINGYKAKSSICISTLNGMQQKIAGMNEPRKG